jgi:hypothetical protein
MEKIVVPYWPFGNCRDEVMWWARDSKGTGEETVNARAHTDV